MDDNVVDMSGRFPQRGIAAATLSLGDLTQAALTLAVERSLQMINKPVVAVNDSMRIHELAFRLGYIRGVLEMPTEFATQMASVVQAQMQPGANPTGEPTSA